MRIFIGQRKALARKLDGGSDYFFQRQLAIFLFRVNQAGNRAGDAYGPVSDDAGILVGVWENVALSVQIHVFRGRGGRFFAEVDEMSFAVGVAEKKEAASAKISGLGMNDGEREAGGDGGIDGIASGLQHLNPGARGKLVNAGDDGVRSVRGTQRRGRDGRG